MFFLGSLALSKTLQTDPPLKKLIWDDNNISIVGLRIFVIGLERNFHLSSMPTPINDLTKMMQVCEFPSYTNEKRAVIQYLLKIRAYRLVVVFSMEFVNCFP